MRAGTYVVQAIKNDLNMPENQTGLKYPLSIMADQLCIQSQHVCLQTMIGRHDHKQLASLHRS